MKKKIYKKLIFILFLIILFFFVLLIYWINKEDKIEKKYVFRYLSSNTQEVPFYSYEREEKKLIKKGVWYRGSKVSLDLDSYITYQDEIFYLVDYLEDEYYVSEKSLVSLKSEIVLEKEMYVLTPNSMIKGIDDNLIVDYLKKGEKVEILGFDKVNSSGEVHLYQARVDDKEGYIYGKYLVNNEQDSQSIYYVNNDSTIFSSVKNPYGGGEAKDLDYFPYEKANFSNNLMPSSVYALYLNGGENVISQIDDYINFAKETKINAFVVDIKDNEAPSFPSQVAFNNSPTSYEKAINSYDNYKKAISKLKEAGFYVIGRITVFKDNYLGIDHPEYTIYDESTKTSYLHNGSHWPSAYSTNVWYYNVELAKEAVEEFGFNEINFDYVRFPDRLNKEGLNFRNTYDLSRVEAIQGFVRYATDRLHENEVYVSVDVFGETANGTYTTAYGQFWPAISNIVDVISGMPYPDHFSNYSYGIDKPWNHPYELMHYWGSYAMDRQKETATPAKVRTWIQAYDVMKYVDKFGISYNAKEVEEEVRGLYDAGLVGGYITWLSSSSLDKYKQQQKAFNIDYGKEYGIG